MVRHITGSTEYFTHGTPPRVLLLSGMHGDEYESGELLHEWIDSTQTRLPPFMYIPMVSPSAVAAHTRRNAYGNDINRKFTDDSTDPEARITMDIVRKHHFDICIDLHEDPDRTMAFYLYDSDHMTPDELSCYREVVGKTSARLYTGIDDMDDELLGCHIEKGYYSFRPDVIGEDTDIAGFSSKWMIQSDITTRFFTLEIPGKADRTLKRSVIGQVVPYILETFGRIS